MTKLATSTSEEPRRMPDLSDPKVRAERRAEAERLVRDEAARRRSRRLAARTA